MRSASSTPRTPLARERGYTAGTFSFNSGNGRCPTCGGNGSSTSRCSSCPTSTCAARLRRQALPRRGARGHDPEGRSIADVLDLTVSEALASSPTTPTCASALQPLADVGLEYLRLGQPVPTLSGGEAQRLKLAGHLAAAVAPARLAQQRPSGTLAVPVRRTHHRPAFRRRREAAARLPPADRAGTRSS
jgi:excinuclease ABC subunit A